MDQREARDILTKELVGYRGQPHAALQRLLKSPATYEVQGESGKTYQVEIQALWDSCRGGNIRVRGAIDDKGWSAFRPTIEDFIMAPDGRYIGEDANEESAQAGRKSALRRFLLLSLGAGGTGLIGWCILDYFLVKFAPTRIHEFDWVFMYFPLAVLLAGLFAFRSSSLAARVTWSIATALTSSLLAVLLVLFLGIQFHLAIGGSL